MRTRNNITKTENSDNKIKNIIGLKTHKNDKDGGK